MEVWQAQAGTFPRGQIKSAGGHCAGNTAFVRCHPESRLQDPAADVPDRSFCLLERTCPPETCIGSTFCQVGKGTIDSILINAVVPLLLLWGQQQAMIGVERALDLLEQIPAEDNEIIRKWKKAWHASQACRRFTGSSAIV